MNPGTFTDGSVNCCLQSASSDNGRSSSVDYHNIEQIVVSLFLFVCFFILFFIYIIFVFSPILDLCVPRLSIL